MRNKIILLSLCLVLLSGCGSDDTPKSKEINAVIQGDYNVLLPLDTSDSRNRHSSKQPGSMFDVFEIGKGLYDRSKKHFSPDSYIQKEGDVLTFKKLQKLLGRQSNSNDIGLNPEAGTSFDTGDGQVVDSPFIVDDIYEIDFMKGDELSALSIAIVLQPDQKTDAFTENKVAYEKTTTISEATLRAYGEEAARKLVSYLRSQPQVGDGMPIYVTLYNVSSADNTLPGSFIAESYFKPNSRSSSFDAIEEEWVLFPSDGADKMDGATSTHFNSLRQSLYQFLPEDVSIIGKGLYIDKKIDTLYIDISVQAKTYTECQALIQQSVSLLDNFTDQDMAIKVNVLNGKETIAVMNRNKNSKKVTLTMLI